MSLDGHICRRCCESCGVCETEHASLRDRALSAESRENLYARQVGELRARVAQLEAVVEAARCFHESWCKETSPRARSSSETMRAAWGLEAKLDALSDLPAPAADEKGGSNG